MSDTVPQLDLGMAPDGHPVVMIGEAGEEARDMATLLRLAPGIALPAHAAEAAELVNHLARGTEYDVITDPAAYRREYEAQLAQEDPNAPFRQGVNRKRDFGVPDFAEIMPPRFEGHTLVFFAQARPVGLPYRVVAADLAKPPVYTPLALTPLPPAPGVDRSAPTRKLSPEEERGWEPIKPGGLPR